MGCRQSDHLQLREGIDCCFVLVLCCSEVADVLLSDESSPDPMDGRVLEVAACSALAVVLTASIRARVLGAKDVFEVRLELRETSAMDSDMRSVENGRCGRDAEDGESPVWRNCPKLRANGSTSRSCCEKVWLLTGVRAS